MNPNVNNNMNPKLLLVRGICLLYRESQITGQYEHSYSLMREIIQHVGLPAIQNGFNHEREILEGLKGTALYMCETPPDYVYDQAEFLQRLKINTLEEESLYEAICDGIVPELTEEELKRTCLSIKRELNAYFKEHKLFKIVNDAAYMVKFSRAKITNMKEFVSKLSAELEPYMIDIATKDPAVITDVSMNNLDQVTKVFNGVRKSANGVGILKTGWQGLNRMLNGGIRRGELVVIGALQSKYKTGFSLTLFKQIAMYNIPEMIDPKKKPMLLRISFEDSTQMNFQFLYQSLKENETGQKVDLIGVPDEEMARYVQEKLSVAGYNVHFMHVNPSLWTYKDICNKIIEFESNGYEVHMCMLDYLIKIPTTGCDQGAMGTDVFNLYERIGNFMRARGIACVTPHQLSTDAKRMIREGRTDFVKSLPNCGYYMKSSQIDQVVDLEIFIHIEILNGISYLTIQKGRHRGIQTPIKHQYLVLPFQIINGEAAGIMDDLNGEDSSLKHVGATRENGVEVKPFWLNGTE